MKYDWSSHNRTLIGLTVPMAVEQFLRISMGNINVFLLGQYSDEAVAAVGVANQFITMGQMLLTLAANGAAVIISQYLGAGDNENAEKAVSVTLIVSLLMGLVVCPWLVFTPTLFVGHMNLTQAIMEEAAGYLRVVGGALLWHGVFGALSATCRCYRYPRLPMYAIVVMNILNLTGSIWAVFGFGENVTACIAWVNAGSTLAGTAILALATVRRLPIKWNRSGKAASYIRLAGQILHIGMPGGLESVSYNASQIITTGMVAGLGMVTVSAKSYLNSIVVYIYVCGMCFGQACQLVAARMGGAGELEKVQVFVKRNFKINLMLNVGISLCVIASRKPLAGLLTGNNEIAGLICNVLVIDLFIQAGRALNHCYTSSLRAVGDVRFTMTVMIASTWLVSVPLCYIFSVYFCLGLYGIWMGFAVDECLRGILSLFRWRKQRWKKGMEKRLAEMENMEKKEISAASR